MNVYMSEKNYPENKETVKFSLGETCSDAA